MTQTTVVAHPSGFFKKFSCLTAFIVALAKLGAFSVHAASQDNSTNPANQSVPSQIQPTNQGSLSTLDKKTIFARHRPLAVCGPGSSAQPLGMVGLFAVNPISRFVR
jgi:hypothetical protein